MSLFQALHFIIFPLQILVGILISGRSFYLLRVHWNESWILQRSRKIIAFLCGATLIQFIVVYPALIAGNVKWGYENNNDWAKEYKWTRDAVDNLTFQGMIVFYFGRIFSLFFRFVLCSVDLGITNEYFLYFSVTAIKPPLHPKIGAYSSIRRCFRRTGSF